MREKRSEFCYGRGCNSCANTGYRRRCGAYEILQVSKELSRLILANAITQKIREEAIKDGMVPMWCAGMLKVK